MKQKIRVFLPILLCFTILFTMSAVNVQAAATTLTENATGIIDGFNYELWKDRGTTSMTLNGGGKYSCSWSNINNALFRTGKKFDQTKTYKEIGNISLDYTCNYQPNGNSYLAVYGWTTEPLVEYYIIDSWGTWKPPGNVASKGQITVDGGTYDIYVTDRIDQPSILGNKSTFKQYWSVRTSKRTSGTISVSEHFKQWEKKGLNMGGKFYEASLVVEGYQSSGTADVTKMDLNIGGDTPTNPDDPTTPVTERSAFTTLEAESYNSTNSTTIQKIGTDNGGSGVGYIENGNYLVFNKINFGTGASTFKTHIACGNASGATVQLRLGSPTGKLIGSLNVPSTGGWDTYKDLSTTVSGASSTQDLYLCFDGPVNVDSFIFGAGSQEDTVIYLGDVDNNGTVNAFDLAVYKQFLLGKIKSLPSAIAGDVDQNGTTDVIDYAKLKQHLLGIIKLGTIKKGKNNDTPVDPSKKLIALTFDDGPSATLTPLVLDKLDKYKAKGTFLMIGQNINSSTSAVIKRINDSGYEIGNHSWSYSSMDNMSASDIRTSINNTTAAIKQYSGQTPKFFRAPNLAYSQTLYSACDLTFIQGVICNDWQQSVTAQQRANYAIQGAKDGAIILLHDNQPTPHPTPEALDIIIPTLQSQGYQFVTLSELFAAKGVTLSGSNDKVYSSVP